MQARFHVRAKVKFEKKSVNGVTSVVTRLVPVLDHLGSVEFMKEGCPPRRHDPEGKVVTWEHMAIVKFPINSPCRVGAIRAESGEFQVIVMTLAISQAIQKYCKADQFIDVQIMPPQYDLEHESESSEKAVQGNYRT